MSWYNPLSWGGDVAKDVMSQIGKSIRDVGDYAKSHPVETGAAIAVVLGSISAIEAAKTGGRRLGTAAADGIIEITKEEYEVD